MFDGDADRLRSLSVAAARVRVQRELVGRARDRRRRVRADDEIASSRMVEIMAPVTLRVRRARRTGVSACIRPDTMIDVAWRWQYEIPPRFRLSFEQRVTGTAAAITERRICYSLTRCDDWTESEYKEPALSILLIEMLPDKRRTTLVRCQVVATSLHALARWFQRTPHPTEAMLMADLDALGRHVASVVELKRRDFTVSLPRGVWTAHLIEIRNGRTGLLDLVCAARTWISGDMIRSSTS